MPIAFSFTKNERIIEETKEVDQMNVTYQLADAEYQIQSIAQFLVPDCSDWWLKGFTEYYPALDWRGLCALHEDEKRQQLHASLDPLIAGKTAELKQKVIAYQQHWDRYQEQITKALEDAFGIDLHHDFQNMQGMLTLNLICPRYLDEQRFDIFCASSERGALGLTLHEIIHFVWFHVWQTLFQDDSATYETPHLTWVFSEMVVACIMQDERLSSINPYMQEGGGGCVYDYFYTMQVDGAFILTTLRKMYQQHTIQEFMKLGIAYVAQHEQIIREQMK